MNALAKAAVAAVTDPAFEAEAGYCQRFVRQVVQAVAGDQFDHLWAESATATARRCLAAGLAVVGTPRAGDLLYRTQGAGGFGHVGICLGDGRVAENSSTKVGRVQGAKGYRSLKQYGAVDVLVRLGVGEEWQVSFPDGRELAGLEIGERVHVSARSWSRALGLSFEQAQRRVRIGGRVIAHDTWQRNGEPWLPVRALASAAGLVVEVIGRRVRIRRPAAAA